MLYIVAFQPPLSPLAICTKSGRSSWETGASYRLMVRIQLEGRCDVGSDGEKRVYANAQTPPKLIRKHCAISADGEKLLETAVTGLGLSARAHDP